MTWSKQHWVWLTAMVLLTVACVDIRADAKTNPYDSIVDRNPFGLKPPPPPDPDAGKPPPPPPAPLATVELTGITSILSSKRALLEIVPGPGKPMLKPILAEGERVESVEVVSINVEKNEVVLKNGNITTNLTFKVAKAAPAAAAPPGALPPGAVPHPAVMPQPTQTSYNQSGRNNVQMAGGTTAATPTAGTPGYGGANSAGANTPTLSGGTTADGSFRSIPSRKILSNPTAPQMSAEEQTIAIEQNRRANPNLPLPPTALTPPDIRERIQQNPYQDNSGYPNAPQGTTPRPGWVPPKLASPPQFPQ